jgi:hypothetical protein
LLAWTTTPWTLPGNVALAIGEKIKYALVKAGGENYILAKDRVETVFVGKEYKIEKEFCKEVIIDHASAPMRENYQYQISDGLEPAIISLPNLEITKLLSWIPKSPACMFYQFIRPSSWSKWFV